LITFNDRNTHTYTHTHTISRTPQDEESARNRDLHLKTHNTHKKQVSMPPAGFETAIPASERPQTHTLDRAATGIDQLSFMILKRVMKCKGKVGYPLFIFVFVKIIFILAVKVHPRTGHEGPEGE
jgi:hypothetical protein